jgi:hypothetical protein
VYWLAFLALTVALYVPPLNVGQHLWIWVQGQQWRFAIPGWGAPAWWAYLSWLFLAYLSLGTALHLAHRRLPQDSPLSRAALRVSQSGLGSLEVVMVLVSVSVLVLAWPLLPAAQLIYGWSYAISLPVAALAALFLLAEGLRLAENHYWADRAFAARRRHWLRDHGYHR